MLHSQLGALNDLIAESMSRVGMTFARAAIRLLALWKATRNAARRILITMTR